MRDNRKLAGLALLVFGFAFWALNFDELERSLHFYTFQLRDLHRAWLLATGQPIFFGPEATGGGNLPGPFYYFLLMIPALFSAKWLGAFFLLAGLSAAAATAGWMFFVRRFSFEAGVFWLALFLLSPFLENFISSFLNVSYQTFFLVLMVISIAEAFVREAADERKGFLYTAFLLAGCTIQLHFSSVALLLAPLTLQLAGPRWGFARFPWKTFAAGVGLFVLPMLPYLVWLIAKELGHAPGQSVTFSGEVTNALPSMFSFTEWPTWDRIYHAFDFLALGFPLAVWVLAAAELAGRRLLKPEQRSPASGRSRYRTPLFLCTLFGLIPALYVFIAPIGYRYGAGYTVAAVFLAVVLLNEERTRAEAFLFTYLGVACFIVFSAYTLVTNGWRDVDYGMHSRHWLAAAAIGAGAFLRWSGKPGAGPRLAMLTAVLLLGLMHNPSMWTGDLANHENTTPPTVTWRRIAKIMCDQTGWTAEDMAQRLYFVGGHMETDPRLIFRDMDDECMKTGALRRAEKPSGYFLTFVPYYEDKQLDFKTWLLQQPIPEDIKEGVRDGGIVLEKGKTVGVTSLVAYHVKDQRRFPLFFHNIGIGYYPSVQQKFLQRAASPDGVAHLEKGVLLTWNECQDAQPYCLTGMNIQVEQEAAKARITVTVLGDSLSQNSPWITPTWTLGWSRPYVEIRCGDQVQTVVLAKTVGYSREYSYASEHYANFYLANHSLLTPFRRVIEMNCRPTEIAGGYEAALVEQLQNQRVLPARRRSVSL